jgi:hypothetical protein
MEDFELSSIESSGLWNSPEAVKEKSEKQREAYKKAQAQLQRTQKDEKKAKHDNDELFQVLSRFIQNPYYEELIPNITELLHISTPSRCVLSLIALIYPDAALYLCDALGKREKINMLQTLHTYQALWEFREDYLDQSIRDWMSFWIHAMDSYIGDTQASVIMQKKLQEIMSTHAFVFEQSIAWILSFFFRSRNISIPESTVQSYALFIKRNMETAVNSSLIIHPDGDILLDREKTPIELFGL